MESKLGRYEIIEELGKGGMGIVYRGTDPLIGRTVAIKTIRVFDEGSEREVHELRTRLMRESQAAGILSHPNIVAVYDVGEQGNTAYVVMEYIAGRTLEQMLTPDAAAVPRDEAIRILKEAARALDYAHEKGVVHRDVKPANIMVQPDGAVKIADFGIAKVLQGSTVTHTAAMIGSPHYMAPEQLKGESVSGATDQYALATVAYSLLTGHKPFESDTMASLMARTLYEDPPAASTQNGALTPIVDQVLKKALAKDPASRYPTCSAFMQALDDGLHNRLPAVAPAETLIATGVSAAAVQNAPAAQVPAPKPNRTWLIAGTVAALFIALGAVGIYLFNRPTRTEQSASITPAATAVPAATPVTPAAAPQAAASLPPTTPPDRQQQAPPVAAPPATEKKTVETAAAHPPAKSPEPKAPEPKQPAVAAEPAGPSAHNCADLMEWTPVVFQGCLDFWTSKGSVPAAIATYAREGNYFVTGSFQPGGSRLLSLLADPVARQDDFQRLVKQGYRPETIHATASPDGVRMTTTWVPRDGPFEIRPALLRDQFEKQSENHRKGLTVADVTAYQMAGPVRYAVIWAKQPVETESAVDLPPAELNDRNQQMTRNGYRLSRLSLYNTMQGRRAAAVWSRDSGPFLWFIKMNRETLVKRNAEAEARGFKLHYVSSVDDDFSAIWWK